MIFPSAINNDMKKSFTLIEILVVTTIIVLLTATAAVSYSQFLKQSRDTRRKADVEQIRAALEMYRSVNDTYPTVGLSQLTTPTVYIQSIPKDPKGENYYYSGSTSDYFLGAYLEIASGTCGGSCEIDGGESNCNYCAGPYGVIPNTIVNPPGPGIPTPTPTSAWGEVPTPTPTISHGGIPTPTPTTSQGGIPTPTPTPPKPPTSTPGSGQPPTSTPAAG